MNAQEARQLGRRIAALVQNEQDDEALALLAPVLAARTPFRLLGHIGQAVGAGPLVEVNTFLDLVASAKTEGGWVVLASALSQQVDRDSVGAYARSRAFVIAADIWYAPDIFGERVPGPALIDRFQMALDLLAPWREDGNRWVRRTVGVAVHFWAKRSRGAPDQVGKAKALLAFLEPMFEESDMDAVKGVGWGLKTLGRNFPETVADWLVDLPARRNRRYRALMLRKALTFLPDDQRARVMGDKH